MSYDITRSKNVRSIQVEYSHVCFSLFRSSYTKIENYSYVNLVFGLLYSTLFFKSFKYYNNNWLHTCRIHVCEWKMFFIGIWKFELLTLLTYDLSYRTLTVFTYIYYYTIILYLLLLIRLMYSFQKFTLFVYLHNYIFSSAIIRVRHRHYVKTPG